ncbi:BTB/POZ domain-containing protein At1g63850 [Linum grandiflorum]
MSISNAESKLLNDNNLIPPSQKNPSLLYSFPLMATTTSTTTTTTKTTPSPSPSSSTAAAAVAITRAHLTVQPQPIKPKRRNYRETTISSSAAAVVEESSSAASSVPDSSFEIRFDSPPVMDLPNGHYSSSPSNFTKFNSALTAGLLNPMSPPPDRMTRSSPTLFEMMANEHDSSSSSSSSQQQRTQNQTTTAAAAVLPKMPQPPVQDRQTTATQRIAEILGSRSPGNQFNDSSSGDVKLTLSSKDGISLSISVHRQILVAHSRFFAVKLSDRWAKQQEASSGPYVVEIADCDDIEVYIESLMLMYSKDLRRRLMKEDVSKVLGILKVSAAIGFDAGVLSCLEYLEAAPWAEDEEEKVASLLSELRLEGIGARDVLKRVSIEVNNNGVEENGSDSNEEVILELLHVVLEGKDEKARRDMKVLVAKMLKENASSSSQQTDLKKESLYSACEGCLKLLRTKFLEAGSGNFKDAGQIARQADNLHWLLDIMIDRQIAEEFLKTWASLTELSEAHTKVPAVHRYEVSRVTARLFVGVGKGQMLASKEARFMLLQTWLVPFYDDFGWMRRGHKGLDRHLIEEGLSNTILTLPLSWQQDILLAWFNRFLNSGEDCPNIQRGFEVWWRRAFWKRGGGDRVKTPALRVVSATTTENS